ncbi:SaV-like [uncultured Caudovirales phage]|uniref:SaV-like n=1 Tax=uncultured Caudovirales phage TaxID=2100421 RepID=A0A6J5LK44_9CAUD|nr:SaV-like [uncultured Caudovirales phage]
MKDEPNDWIEWHGGKCPIKDGEIFDVKLRSGDILSRWSAESVFWDWGAESVFWERKLSFGSYDIVAYRIIKEPEQCSSLQKQCGGTHYKDMKIQPFEYIHANKIPFAEGSVIKYVSRWRAKGGIEDLKKARHFLDLLIEAEQNEPNT